MQESSGDRPGQGRTAEHTELGSVIHRDETVSGTHSTATTPSKAPPGRSRGSGLPRRTDRGVRAVSGDQGESLSDVDLAVIAHADHFGGNHQLREHSPGVTIACHETDRAWVESVDRS